MDSNYWLALFCCFGIEQSRNKMAVLAAIGRCLAPKADN
jgi:hypothetical protein